MNVVDFCVFCEDSQRISFESGDEGSIERGECTDFSEVVYEDGEWLTPDDFDITDY